MRLAEGRLRSFGRARRQLRTSDPRPGASCRSRRRHRHRPQARRNAARHPAGNPDHQPGAARACEPRQRQGFLALRAEPLLQRHSPGTRHDLLPRRRRRLVLVHRRRLRRDLPRRAAAHAERAAAGDPAHRHRAHRGAARAAGHALRFELAGGDAALHHEQAGPGRLHDGRRARRLYRGRGRRGLRGLRAS